MTQPTFVVYSRPGCHLCEVLIEQLTPLLRGRAHLEVRNSDLRTEWQETFGERIPVVELDGRVLCQFRLNKAAIIAALDSFAASGDAARERSGV